MSDRRVLDVDNATGIKTNFIYEDASIENLQLSATKIIYDDINTQEKWLELQVNLLRKNNLDSDMLDERVRVMLNYVHPDELVIISGTTD